MDMLFQLMNKDDHIVLLIDNICTTYFFLISSFVSSFKSSVINIYSLVEAFYNYYLIY